MKSKKFIRSNPQLPVRNLRETLDYYRDTLGFHDEWIWTNNNGKETDGGIRSDDMRLLFAEDPYFADVREVESIFRRLEENSTPGYAQKALLAWKRKQRQLGKGIKTRLVLGW